MWTKDDIRILLVDDMTDHPIVTARITTPDGEVTVMAEANEVNQCLILRNFHIHGENIRPRQFGYARLRSLVSAVIDTLENYDEIIIEGAVRTSGAGKGHRPRPIRFTRPALLRKVRSEPEHPGSGHRPGQPPHANAPGASADDQPSPT
jgi:CTP-dependent riboflavin kinase